MDLNNTNSNDNTNDNKSTNNNKSTRPLAAPGKSLSDFINNCQQLSAHLPPDGWIEDTPPRRIKRSSTLSLSLADIPNRGTASAPTPQFPPRPSSQQPTRPWRYVSNPAPHTNIDSTQDVSESPPLVKSTPNMPPPSSSKDKLSLCMNQDGPYPIIFPKTQEKSINDIHPALRPTFCPARAARPAPPTLVLPRTRPHITQNGSGTSLLLRGGGFSPTNAAHLPSPLRNVSLPGDNMDDVELLPRSVSRTALELAGPAEEKSWFWKWFACGGCRKKR
ncbi:hypothetical protein GRF29_216g663593 [Pseudopithomyces chartarum]|uniref:Uncharacterized protein n=1 Tax=Pseudopithomyces chartarum TaxID=1892770 RepID=A0AAN6RAY4_9PLEO|nr:hypothetical protein GRF29_216g663593 [Pseudopithomyces chartarum]